MTVSDLHFISRRSFDAGWLITTQLWSYGEAVVNLFIYLLDREGGRCTDRRMSRILPKWRWETLARWQDPSLMPRLGHYRPRKPARPVIDDIPHPLPYYFPHHPLPFCLCSCRSCPLSLIFLSPLGNFGTLIFDRRYWAYFRPGLRTARTTRDSKEAKKEKTHNFKNHLRAACFHNHPLHVMPAPCLIPPPPEISQCFITLGCFHIPQRFPLIPLISDILTLPLLSFSGAHPCLCPGPVLTRTQGQVVPRSRAWESRDRTKSGYGSRHFSE